MPGQVLRAARLLSTLTDRAYIQRRTQAAIVSTAAWLTAGLLGFIAALFALIALFAALSERMPVWAAALVIAAGAVLLAAIAVLVARRPKRRIAPPPPDPRLDALAGDPMLAVSALLAPLLGQARDTTRRQPGESILLLLVAGLLVGQWLKGRGK